MYRSRAAEADRCRECGALVLDLFTRGGVRPCAALCLTKHQSHFLDSPCENSMSGLGMVLQLPWQYR